MLKTLVVLVFITSCLAQQIAKKKCEEYTALAKARPDSLPCTALTDNNTGVKVEPNEFPATAVLGFVTNNNTGEVKYVCDAVLISEDTLLTAGHCLNNQKFGKPKWARIGATHSTLGIEVEVAEARCHPQYKPGHDIAVIKLKERLNSSFIPACLDTEVLADGTKVIGVGRPIGTAYPELWEKCPIKSQLEVQPGQACVKVYPKQNIDTEATLCTKDPTSGPGDCLSGPLYVPRQPCVHVVTGIASFGKVCKTKIADNVPSVYTRVAHYVPWIESLTWPTSQPV